MEDTGRADYHARSRHSRRRAIVNASVGRATSRHGMAKTASARDVTSMTPGWTGTSAVAMAIVRTWSGGGIGPRAPSETSSSSPSRTPAARAISSALARATLTAVASARGDDAIQDHADPGEVADLHG